MDVNNDNNQFKNQRPPRKPGPTVAGSNASYLKSIDSTVKDIFKFLNGSQSNFRNATGRSNENYTRTSTYSKSKKFRQDESIFDDFFKDDFIDQFEKGILDALLGSDFSSELKSIFKDFTSDIADNISDIPKQLGQALGRSAVESLKNSKIGKPVVDKVEDYKSKAASSLKDKANKFSKWYNENVNPDSYRTNNSSKQEAAKKAAQGSASAANSKPAENVPDLHSVDSDAVSGTLSEVGNLLPVVSEVSTEFAGVASTVASASPYILAAVVAISLLTDSLTYVFGPAVNGTKKLFEGLNRSGHRYHESMQKNTEYELQRVKDDVRSMVEAPFTILKEAAQNLYDAWDNNVRTINATQGYSKDDLYTLIGNFADRLRSEGLSSVISSADITTNLSKVLQAGLSGRVAEEFAYVATKLNAAIPTQDFFGYAETYASIAAQQIAQGKSQAEAISYANKQIELFASDVLYASRQLSEGFSTGLSNASDIFTKSVQIAQAAKTGDPSQIAGILTSVASVTGAIAPDLATSIVDAVVKSAVGGNDSSLVALRSLAGINASNTEFLHQLASDPKKVFSVLFSNLSQMQNMSQSAYMEVAEGLSSVFGISMDAFARIDFNYLAKAIERMNIDNSALTENIDLLASGETTTNQEALRMQQINQYMIDEGLAYVLDNQTARSIQEHMWDEQIARDLMEASYAVDLQGSALEFLDGIKTTIDRILDFLNPIGALIKTFTNISATSAERSAQDADIRQLLELGKLGAGNFASLYSLTTRGQPLHLVSSIVDMMGGHSSYAEASNFTQGFNEQAYGSSRSITMQRRMDSLLNSAIQYSATSYLPSDVSSLYKWGTLGKWTSTLLASSSPQNSAIELAAHSSTSSSTLSDAVKSKIQEMLSQEYMQKIIDSNTTIDKYGHSTVAATFEDWIKSANNMGISNISKSLETYGYNKNEIEKAFEDLMVASQATASAAEESELKAAQFRFYKSDGQFDTYWSEMKATQENIINLLGGDTDSVIYLLKNFHTDFGTFAKSWTDYWINHTTYDNRWSSAEVDRIKKQEKTDSTDAIYALANALTGGFSDLSDPTVQTNTLLGQILLVVNAIMQQNNQVSSGLSLPDTLSGLALGLIK